MILTDAGYVELSNGAMVKTQFPRLAVVGTNVDHFTIQCHCEILLLLLQMDRDWTSICIQIL